MATTDYDAPRRSTVEETDSDVESLDALASARAEKQSPLADVDEGDTDDAIDQPGADLTGEELTMPVVPKQADEFTCTSCFLAAPQPDRLRSRNHPDLHRLRLTQTDAPGIRSTGRRPGFTPRGSNPGRH